MFLCQSSCNLLKNDSFTHVCYVSVRVQVKYNSRILGLSERQIRSHLSAMKALLFLAHDYVK